MPQPDPAATITASAADVDRLLELAEAFAARQDDGAAAAAVEAAAGLAHRNHTGVMALPRAETVLRQIGARLPEAPAATELAGRGGVLHVLTAALPVGGHTRLVWRWMERCADRPQSLALTLEPSVAVPPGLLDAVESSGGLVHVVPPGLDRPHAAAWLRRLACHHDLIVVTANPEDAIPELALTDVDGRPPVVVVDHADHAPWLGRTCADLVLDHRAAGRRMTITRRGVPERRTAHLRLPLPPAPDPPPPAQRRAARALLDIDDDAVLAATIGSEIKYAWLDRHLADVLGPVLAAEPRLHVVAAGPPETDRWAELAASFPGRVRALGQVVDVHHLRHAADVYLDSWPCSGSTAAMEAALDRLPVLALDDDPHIAHMGSVGAEERWWSIAPDADAYVDTLRAWIADPARRLADGTAARTAVIDAHDPSRWRAALAAAEARARDLGPVMATELGDPAFADDGHDATLVAFNAAGNALAPGIVRTNEARLRALLLAPETRRLLSPRIAGWWGQIEAVQRAQHVVAAPALTEAGTIAAVDALRAFMLGGLAEQASIAIPPGAETQALPLLEAALARGEDVDLNVAPTADPVAYARAIGALPIRVPEDRFTAVPAA